MTVHQDGQVTSGSGVPGSDAVSLISDMLSLRYLQRYSQAAGYVNLQLTKNQPLISNGCAEAKELLRG